MDTQVETYDEIDPRVVEGFRAIEELDGRIVKIKARIKEIQEVCPHQYKLMEENPDHHPESSKVVGVKVCEQAVRTIGWHHFRCKICLHDIDATILQHCPQCGSAMQKSETLEPLETYTDRTSSAGWGFRKYSCPKCSYAIAVLEPSVVDE